MAAGPGRYLAGGAANSAAALAAKASAAKVTSEVV
jgi:hypothetical protein